MSEVDTVEREEATVADKPLGSEVAIYSHNGVSVAAPKTYEQLTDMAQLMSRGGPMVGKSFREKPGACLAIIQLGHRLKQDPYMLSLKAYTVGDTIGFEAQAVHAIVLTNAPLSRRPRFYFSGEGETRRCKVLFWVKGEEEPFDYESPEIGKIPIKNSPLWKNDPDQQLGYYSVRAGARRHFPDVIMGVYTADELAHQPVDGGTVVEGEPFRLTKQAEEAAQDADFTDVGASLERKAAEKPKTTAKADKKKAAPKDGPKAAVGETVPNEGTAAQPKPVEPAADSKPAEQDEVPTDAEIVASVEAAEKGAKGSAKGTFIKAEKGALTRIRETSEDAALVERAGKLLDKYED